MPLQEPVLRGYKEEILMSDIHKMDLFKSTLDTTILHLPPYLKY